MSDDTELMRRVQAGHDANVERPILAAEGSEGR